MRKLLRKILGLARTRHTLREQLLQALEANNVLVQQRNDAWAESRRLCAERDADISNHCAEWKHKCARLERMWEEVHIENVALRRQFTELNDSAMAGQHKLSADNQRLRAEQLGLWAANKELRNENLQLRTERLTRAMDRVSSVSPCECDICDGQK